MRNRLTWVHSTLAVGVALAVVAAGEETNLPPPVADEVVPITFTTGNGWQYDGRIELPPADRRRDWGVMMFGGGMGTSIDWLVTGALTIDGNATRDGDTIARALLEKGFVVMRWHAIRRGDPLHAKDPLMMDAPPAPLTVEQAKLAFEAFNKKGIVPPEHLFLLGHSLGARRACILMEKHPRVAGMVMLAGAALIPSDLPAAREIVRQASANSEVAEGKRLGIEDVHEFRVRRLQASRDRWFKGIAGTGDRWGGRWPADLIAENKTPTLLVAGTLDERWLLESYLFTTYMREHKHPDYTWRVFDNIGHNLAPEQPGAVEYGDQGVIADSRTGPIDPRVVEEIVQWVAKRAK